MMNEQTEQVPKANLETTSSQPNKWWQWVLVYPALAMSLLAAIPTIVETFNSMKYQVPWGQSSVAKEQDDLWRINLSCTSVPLDPLLTAHNIEVDATICQSGDVLVRIFPPSGKKFYKWVALNKVINEQSSMNWFSKNAYASSGQEPILLALNGTIICQKYLSPGRVLRRISVQGQGCFDEVVNTYTGVVESTTPASCDAGC